MTENIDVRISNYLTILGNRDMVQRLDPSVVRMMEKAVAIYMATTSKEYVTAYEREQVSQQAQYDATRSYRQ